MRSTFRAVRHFAGLVPLLALAAAPALSLVPQTAFAAGADAASDAPWLYRGSDVPQDKEWVFGQLPNGVRYAVRKNGVPPGQVSIRIRMDVGSLYETDSEKGYAHLLEHLVFRQSRYLADGAAIPTWQRLGATFGSDTNAETTPVSTTFKLDLPNVTPASLDESFKLLSGMIIAPTLSEANVRADVPIVLAEKRERGGTAERVSDATQQTLFAGQRMAVRPVIGTVETLEAANEASVRAFHDRWYRPENCVIVAAGDVDAAMLESLARKYFSEWPVRGKAGIAPPFGDPVAPRGSDPANPVGEMRVLVEPDLPRGINYAVLRPWRQVQDSIVYNQGLMIDSLAQAIINRRLETRARSGGSYLIAQVNQQKISRSADATFVSITPLGPNWKAALADVRGVIADAIANPPSEDEIEREVAEMNVAFESSVEQRRLQPGARLADDIVSALDIRETVASPETVLDIFNRSRPLFTPAAVLDHTRSLFKGNVVRGIYVTPQAGESDDKALRIALAQPARADAAARLGSKPISFADLPPIGNPGKIAAVTPTGILEIEQVELGNGIKVLLWPTADEPGRVNVKVRWGAGYRGFASGDAAYIALGDMALVGSGQGELGQDDLDRISTGRKMGYDFAINEADFQFSAETRSADLADQLYLFANKFSAPRWDANPVLRAKAAARLQYESYAASPQGVLERDLDYLKHGDDPRFRTPTPAEIEAATPEGFRQVWQPALERGAIEVQLFGDFDRTAALEALRKTFGALPRRAEIEPAIVAAKVAERSPDRAPLVLAHRGDPGQAAALVTWQTGGGMAGVAESRQLEILAQLFSNRLLDKMRERMGASYAPQVVNDWPLELPNGGTVMAMAQLQPASVPQFFQVADEIAADLINTPPSFDELARVTEPLKQQLTRASSSGAFFMFQLEGATENPAKFAALRSLLADYTQTSPQAMQALARKYLTPGNSWRVAILPQGQQLAGGTGPGPAGR